MLHGSLLTFWRPVSPDGLYPEFQACYDPGSSNKVGPWPEGHCPPPLQDGGTSPTPRGVVTVVTAVAPVLTGVLTGVETQRTESATVLGKGNVRQPA